MLNFMTPYGHIEYVLPYMITRTLTSSGAWSNCDCDVGLSRKGFSREWTRARWQEGVRDPHRGQDRRASEKPIKGCLDSSSCGSRVPLVEACMVFGWWSRLTRPCLPRQASKS